MTITFDEKTFVVLGRLSTMTRREARLKIESLGGRMGDELGTDTDYIVLGTRVSATRRASAQATHARILNAREFTDAVEARRAEAASHRVEVEVGEAIATLRGLFDGPASLEVWRQVVGLLDACPPDQLADACHYVEAHISQWPDHRGAPSAPSLVLPRPAGHVPEVIDPATDLRVAMSGWLEAILNGETSPKFKLIRRLNLGGLGLGEDTLLNLTRHPDLIRLRELDVGYGNEASPSFYEALRTSNHLPSLDTFTLYAMTRDHAEALCGAHTLTRLKWVRLGLSRRMRRSGLRLPRYPKLFEATWWDHVEGLDVQVSRSPNYIGSAANIYTQLTNQGSRFTSLKHLVLGDLKGIDRLYGSPLLEQLTRLSVFTATPEGVVGLLKHLDENPGHSIKVLDLSRSNHACPNDYVARQVRRAYFACMKKMKNLGAFDEIVLPRSRRKADGLAALEDAAKDAGVTLTRSPFPK